MPKKVTEEDFIRRARAVHGDKYDYSRLGYKKMSQKGVIVCPIHGEFQQDLYAHLTGQGCPVCGREKRKETMLERYGVDNPMKDPDIMERARQTCVEKYGHRWAKSSAEVQEKMRRTNQERYGVEYPLQSEQSRVKMAETVRLRYGVDSVLQSEAIREKFHKTCLERYGAEEPLAARSIREKIEETNRMRYGGVAPMCSGIIRQKCRYTVLSRYGTDYTVQAPETIRKTLESKRIRGTFNSSSSEDALCELLCSRFGLWNILRQYQSEEYPFACDFYIASKDMYVELNGIWTHGGHWYDSSSAEDRAIVDLWLSRDTPYYRNAVRVWTVSDVKKRDYARKSQLNYAVFWNSDLLDAREWILAGCPNRHDWM